MINNLKQHQQEWFNENASFGKELGYPDCCIKEFCDQPPIYLKYTKRTTDDVKRYNAGCVNGVFTGFIPCINHAKQINTGKIKIEQLISNRNIDFPSFPNL